MERSGDLKSTEVVVRYKLGDSPSAKFTVKIKYTDTLRKIKSHITESLDIQGRVTYGDLNCDDFPSKKLSDCTPKQEDKFVLTAERKRRELRELKHHAIQLKIAEEFLTREEAGTMEIKVARTTTIANLKHKLQDRLGVSIEEQSIYVHGQWKECQSSICVIQLPQPLEVKCPLKPSASMVKRTLPQRSISSGAPYDTKQSCKRKYQEFPPKKPNRKAEAEGHQHTVNVPVQHATYETLHQLGENFEHFKKDKEKILVVACKHKEDNTVEITKYTDVNLLQEYVSKVKLIEGTYIFKGQYIAADVLKVNNGDILEIHKFRQKKDSLHEVRLQISKEIIEIRNIKVPIRITLQLLKFIIQSDVYIKIEHQRFQRNYREWSVNDSYILIPDDFENLTVVDILCIKNDYRPFTAEYEKYHSDEIVPDYKINSPKMCHDRPIPRRNTSEINGTWTLMLPPDPVMLPPICSSATNGTSLVSPALPINRNVPLLTSLGLIMSQPEHVKAMESKLPSIQSNSSPPLQQTQETHKQLRWPTSGRDGTALPPLNKLVTNKKKTPPRKRK